MERQINPTDDQELVYFGHEIVDFLKEHGKPSAQEGGEWGSPDAHQLEDFAALLMNYMEPDHVPFSSWESGGYKPYSDKRAKDWHQSIKDRAAVVVEHFKNKCRTLPA